MMVGMGIMVFMDNIWLTVVSTIIFGIGLGLGMRYSRWLPQNAPHNELGVATASSQLFRNLGGTSGSRLGNGYVEQSTKNLKEALPSNAPDFSSVDPQQHSRCCPSLIRRH